MENSDFIYLEKKKKREADLPLRLLKHTTAIIMPAEMRSSTTTTATAIISTELFFFVDGGGGALPNLSKKIQTDYII